MIAAALRSHRPRVVGIAALVALTLVAAITFVAIPKAGAAVFPVTTTADGGAGSLRDAFTQASGSAEANEIVLQAGETYQLTDCTAAGGDLDHTGTDPLTITGNGATIEQTCPGERVIESGTDITVAATTVTGGDAAGLLGGGIAADTADVTLTGSTVTGNSASIGGGVGAIRATVVKSTVAGNDASSTGGGVWADQTVDVTNSTITGNEAGTSGGGLVVVNDTATLLHATVAGNTAPVGANVQLQQGADALVSFASVIADPQGGDDCDIDAGATTTSQGANFSSDASCGFGAGADDQSDAGDPGLAALADNGGPTLTMLPADGSPLIDGADCAAAPSAVPDDQRGVSRPQGPRCDIGAVEVEVVEPPDDPGDPGDPNGPGDPGAPTPGPPGPSPTSDGSGAELAFTG